VEASAGSGKTTLLVSRILAWVRSGRATLPEIVAITFTEKAAAELRLRVREAVEAARAPAEAEERGRLDRALAELELAPIRTIHAFCGDLLRQRPVEAGIDPGFRIAAPLEAALLFEETWERWLEPAAAEAPPALHEAIALGIPLEALRELASALVVERDLLAGLPAPLAEDFADLNREVRARIRALAEAAPAGRRAAEDDRLVRHLADLLGWVEQTDSLGEAEQVGAVLTELPLRKVSNVGAQTVWGKEPITRARAALTEMGDRVAAARAVRLHNLAAALARWLAGFVHAYGERLARLGLLDFHDLLGKSRELLRTRPDVRRDFQARYRTLLVDEFQDTDPLQLEIAFFLAEDPAGPPAPAWDQVRLAPGRLFLVGDPKQSIYRFRRADIETYARARALVAAQGEILTLHTNFRSVGGLLAAVNRLFESQMQPPEDGAYQPAYAPVVPAPDAPDGDGPLVLEWPPEAPAPASVDERRAGEAAALAAVVRRAVGERGWTVRDPRTGQPRPVGFGDVVCLFRTLGGVALYEDALRAAGVPYRTLGGRHYFARSEVGWALAALTAVEDPYDPVALVAALRSPFFGVPDGALLAHTAAGGRLGYLAPLPPESEDDLAPAWRVLRDLHARRVRESPVAIVEALYAETEVLATYALDPHGEQRVANLLRILDTARALEAAGRGTFRQLVRWLRAQDRGGYEESESPIVEEGDEVVRLMTVHAAKGLEFPVVILPDLEWDRGADSRRLWVDRRAEALELGVALGKVNDWDVESENVAGLREREQRRADAEQLRLFYVATTRARDHLVLPLLGGAPRGFALFCAPLLDEGDAGVRRLAVSAEPPPPVVSIRAAAPALVPADAWAARREAALARGGETAPAYHPGDTGAVRGEGARLGALVHAALARAALDAGPAGAAAAVAAAAAKLGERGPRVPAATALVARALAAPPYRRAASARQVFRELPVSALVDGRLVEGVVDLAFETPQGLAVVEVKLAPAGPEAESQLAVYRSALGAAGLHVAEGWLLLVGPESAELKRV
jgi:ATP-dependent helicase/nuclease subunit A